MRLLVELGVASVMLHDIAAEASCRAPALYRSPPDNDALLVDVHSEGFRRLFATKLDVGDATRSGGLERPRLAGLDQVRFVRDNPNVHGFMFRECSPYRHLASPQTAGDSGGKDLANRSLAFLRDSVIACRAAGNVFGIDPNLAAILLWSTVHRMVRLASRGRVPFDDGDVGTIADRAVATVIRLVVAATRSDTGRSWR